MTLTKSVVKLVLNPVVYARTKHIEVQHHFIRQKVFEQEIEMKNIETFDQVADIFMKALEVGIF